MLLNFALFLFVFSIAMNYYTKLMELKGGPDGETLFYSIQLGLVCISCAKSGSPCNHLLSMNPEVNCNNQIEPNQLNVSNYNETHDSYFCVCIVFFQWKPKSRMAKVDAIVSYTRKHGMHQTCCSLRVDSLTSYFLCFLLF